MQNIAAFLSKYCRICLKTLPEKCELNAEGYAHCVSICEVYCRVRGSGVTIDPSTALLCCKSFYIVLICMLLCVYLK